LDEAIFRIWHECFTTLAELTHLGRLVRGSPTRSTRPIPRSFNNLKNHGNYQVFGCVIMQKSFGKLDGTAKQCLKGY
jgi:hypothetical protein